MNKNGMLACEIAKLEKWSRFQLPHHWKKKGFIMAILVFLFLIVMKFIQNEPSWINELLKRALLLSFLVVSLSKENVDDERIWSLRSKSYALAFVFGVLYALIQPAVDYLVHYYVYEASTINTFSYFQVLSFMLGIQIAFFETLKRNR